jgi:hypothetical protein
MVLAREVRRADNPLGPPICGKGTELSESLIERLKNLGVKSLTVEGCPVEMEGMKGLDELLADLDRRFCKVADVPLMQKLKELHRLQIVRNSGGCP